MTKKTKTKEKKDPPNALQILRLIAGAPNEVETLLNTFGNEPARSYKQVAIILGCSVYKVKKAMNGILEHTSTDFQTLDIWGRAGRPNKDVNLTSESLQYLISRDTLRKQVGMTLQQRAEDANTQFGCVIDGDYLRKIYFKHRITKQKLVAHIAP